MAGIVSCTDEFEEYLRDESRSVGSAESIVFMQSQQSKPEKWRQP